MFSFAPTGLLTDKTICQVDIREAFPCSSGGDGQRESGDGPKESEGKRGIACRK